VVETRLARLFDLVRQKLGAADVRVEIGGKDPTDPHLVACQLPSGWRLVAVFDAPPEDRAAALQRIAALAEAFSDTATTAIEDGPTPSRAVTAHRLDDELDRLAGRVHAARAVVFDDKSPVLWGTSELRRGNEDVETALRTAETWTTAERANVDLCALLDAHPDAALENLQRRGLDAKRARALLREVARMQGDSGRQGEAAWRHHLLAARAVARVRTRSGRESLVIHEPDFGVFARPFATIYWLVLAFDAQFSELHAEAAVIHALPTIERLVIALPPVEPPPRAGQLVRLPPRLARH
jgi:hypothetical protein